MWEGHGQGMKLGIMCMYHPPPLKPQLPIKVIHILNAVVSTTLQWRRKMLVVRGAVSVAVCVAREKF